ncbi:MAG: 3-deoxy-7-phosphoheptulonate synthase [Deltaproteobacteria bacterium]|nr:MAG: 3-deoxy-7-phosphoheptulonate synthase [Deltaproteobacteria bacterium]
MTWAPESWRGLPIQQQPTYDDPEAVEAALAQVRALPPLVHAGEVDHLKAQLARVARGEAFLLQGGDCAERFVDCARKPIEAKLKILLQMSLVLTWGARIPVVRVARMAGQYAKPRSRPTEVVDGFGEVHSYRGDHVNGHHPSERRPDPRRLVDAYFHSAATLNYARALLDGGFADLREAEHWDLGFVREAERRAAYQDMTDRILDALDFVRVTGVEDPSLHSVDLWSSHEGLLLAWEEAQTFPVGDKFYNLGAHLLWIGDRTRQVDGAHVEYFRGIANPIGVKCGPSMAPDELLHLLDKLDPEREPGRVTLITRYGADKAGELLPGHIRAIQREGREVVWSSDPMHGNTVSTTNGYKTRNFDRILDELRVVFEVHRAEGSHLGGVHFELTGNDVTECTGGPQGLGELDLVSAYETFCDPRLNYAQSLEMAFLIARRLQGER